MSIRLLLLGLILVCPQLVLAEAPESGVEVLQPFVDRSEIAGAVFVVADKNSILHQGAVGYADLAIKKKMQVDSLFWIASQSKSMTAAGLMMLVDEGKVSLDDPVEKYLPEFRSQMLITEKSDDRVVLQKPSHPITIREALCHMTGLPFKSELETPTLDGLPLAVAVRSYAMTPLVTEPGTHYQYSNAGINTCGRIIEVVSGKPYEDFMQERLFGPLGMKDTTFWPDVDQIDRLAKSYRRTNEKAELTEVPLGQLLTPLSDHTHRFPMPAGGLFATGGDVTRYCQMLLRQGEMDGKRLLSEAAVKQISTRQTPTTVPQSYGLGVTVNGNVFGHGGAHQTNMEIHADEETGLVLIWMVQQQGLPQYSRAAQAAFKKWAIDRFAKGK